MAKIFIAAGHGGTDPGATSSVGIERDIAEATVDKAIQLCVGQDLKGNTIVKVPHVYGLIQEINYINANITDANHDLCAEVHLNSNAGTPGTGTETYHGNVTLATEMHQEIVKVLGLADRGLKDGNQFMFNNSTNCASCLIELGFVNNQVDVSAIIDRGGWALAKAIVRACGGTYYEKVITYKEEVVRTAVAFTKSVIEDNTMNLGESKVIQAGVAGIRTVVYTITLENGKEISRVVKSDNTVQPVNEITAIGTKQVEDTDHTFIERLKALIQLIIDFFTKLKG